MVSKEKTTITIKKEHLIAKKATMYKPRENWII